MRAKWHRYLLLCLLPVVCSAQRYDTVSVFSHPVTLDSVVVHAGFDVNAFIRRVRADTTFYKAFRNMRFVPYTAVNDIQVYDRHGRVQASLHSNTRQVYQDHCRSTQVISQTTTGDFYDRHGDYNYYTAALYAYLFFAPSPVCNESDIIAGAMQNRESGSMGKSKYELQQLIFNPGSRVSGVPFIGDKASVFDDGEADKYDFRISRDEYNGEPCFVFRITPRKGYEKSTLYNELTTWFRASDYSILARDYSLSYSTWIYDFDVRMSVRTVFRNGKLYPTHIAYDGNWHVATKGRERVRFTADITY
jgi:hypothetical protein